MGLAGVYCIRSLNLEFVWATEMALGYNVFIKTVIQLKN